MRKNGLRKMAAGVCMAACVLSLSGCASSSSGNASETTAAGDNGETGTASETTGSASETTGTDSETTGTGETGTEDETVALELETVEALDFFTIKGSDYVDVSNWKDATVAKKDLEISQNEIDYKIAYQLQNTYSIKPVEITDRAVQAGDTVNIDFIGYVDGEKLDNATAEGQDLQIGSGSFIDGFEDGLIGAKIGDKLDLNLSFPDPYQNNTDLSGKAVKFEVTVNSISGYKDVTDEEIKTASKDEYATYKDFCDATEKSMKEELEQGKKWNAAMEKVEVTKDCEEVIENYKNTYLSMMTNMATSYGIELDVLVSYYYGTTLDEFKELLESTGKDYAKQSCAILAIAEKEGIEVSDEELAEKVQERVDYYGSQEKFEDSGEEESSIKFDILLEKVEQLIYSEVKITD